MKHSNFSSASESLEMFNEPCDFFLCNSSLGLNQPTLALNHMQVVK